MWIYRNRPARFTHPIVLYDWQSSYHTDYPRDFLKDFSRTVIIDGYQVYHNPAVEREDLKVAGCQIHAGRPFPDIINSVGLSLSKGTIAQEAYDMITDILHTDSRFDDLLILDRKKQRQSTRPPKGDAYFAWIKTKYSQVTHNSTIDKAFAYNINQEKSLRVFLSAGNVPPDNNYAEQAIRPFFIGRKTKVLTETNNGARTSAMLYSIVETAKANDINAYQYLELLLTELPKHVEDKNLSFLDTLMLWSSLVQKECPSKFKKS